MPPPIEHTESAHGSEKTPPDPLLVIDKLGVSFDNAGGPRIQAVDGVQLTIYPRQTLAVVGESGCGKSVTAMSALQLIPRPPGRFDRGQIHYTTKTGKRVDLLSLSERHMRDIRGDEIAMIFQEPMTSLNPVYTIGDQIIEAIVLHQNVKVSQAKAIAIQAMTDVGIPDPAGRLRAYPHQFSGGMRQRVMIAMALACQPRLLLADEPTTALDVTIQAQILDLLRDLQRTREMGIMLITHALGVVAENADVVCVMYAGRVVEYANVFELFDHPMHPYTRGLLRSIPRLGEHLNRLTTISEVVDDPKQFTLGEGHDGLIPWWPWHRPPKNVQEHHGPGDDFLLHEIKPGHWVGVWRTEAIGDASSLMPDLEYRIEEDPAAPSRVVREQTVA